MAEDEPSVDVREHALLVQPHLRRFVFAIGELLGSGQLMGRSFCGGMMATPALTFGLMFGKTLPRA